MSKIDDHCRIGSLENLRGVRTLWCSDHCRIGSLETETDAEAKARKGSLPHRQLRNYIEPCIDGYRMITAA